MTPSTNGISRSAPKDERSYSKWALVENPEDRLFTLQEAAELSAVSVPRIKTAISRREVRVVKLGPKQYRILRSELHRWWRANQSRGLMTP